MCGPAHLKKEALHKATSIIERGTSDCSFEEWIYFALHSIPSQSYIPFSCNKEKQDFRVLENVKC